MLDTLLVLNAGSSSLKFSTFTGDHVDHGKVETSDPDAALAGVLAKHPAPVAVGHRVVHGGLKFPGPVKVDDAVLAVLEELVPLAPLHQPHSLAIIRAVSRSLPDVAQVACFDTSFHRTQSEVAQRFGLPRKYHDEGVRRYGFHGLSYESIASRLPEHDPRAAAGRTIVAHLGNGASLCAMHAGRSVATTMGFTPADGLVMGTRVGTLDPGALLYLMNRYQLDAVKAEHLIDRESGLLGVSRISSDMRMLLASDSPAAKDAVELFVYRITRELGSLAAALGGMDSLVFTGGIGENSAEVRARVCRDAGWLGIELDEATNSVGGPRITTSNSRASAWVIPTDEERVIATHTRAVLGLSGASP